MTANNFVMKLMVAFLSRCRTHLQCGQNLSSLHSGQGGTCWFVPPPGDVGPPVLPGLCMGWAATFKWLGCSPWFVHNAGLALLPAAEDIGLHHGPAAIPAALAGAPLVHVIQGRSNMTRCEIVGPAAFHCSRQQVRQENISCLVLFQWLHGSPPGGWPCIMWPNRAAPTTRKVRSFISASAPGWTTRRSSPR